MISFIANAFCSDQCTDPAISILCIISGAKPGTSLPGPRRLHAAVLKAIASGDETAAAAHAARAMVDYAEYYTRSVIVGRATI